MASEPLGLLVFFVYFAAVVLSIPAAAGVLLLARRDGIRRAADLVGLAFVGIVSVAGVLVGGLVDPVAGLALAGLGFVALVVLWAIPVLLGAYVLERLDGTAGETSLGYAVAGLPAALLASVLLFVAPGGLARYNLTFLSGPTLLVLAVAFVALVFLGPGLFGVGLHRLVARRQ